ncbi:MAG TPA: efflux RND transporter periplasmic adaptor subunit [Chryseosolibacter sp.]|nr:efflux RND transporter periplasmic adaptor subunit [Chryseosolibacter sp.]
MAKQRQKSNKLIYWLIGLLSVIVIFLFAASKAGWIGKPKEIEVELANVKRVTIVEKVSASGTVQPVTEVKIAPEVSGEIIDLLVEEGDSVKRGQMLVKIRPDTWESQLQRAQAARSQQRANLAQAEASLNAAKASFIRAEQEFKRQEKLWNEKVISEADWQLARQNYDIAKTDVIAAEKGVEAAKYIIQSTEASLREAQENFRKTSVVAPMDGSVSKLIVKRGERVVGTATMSGTEMLRIADLNVMEVRVDVNENDIVRVSVGDTAVIDVDAYASANKEFKGIVTLIANTAKDKTSADAITEFEVRILILDSSYQDLVEAGNRFPFRPGMTASAEILTTRKENVFAVPLAAVTTRTPEQLKGEQKKEEPNQNATQTANQGSQPKKPEEPKVVIFVNENGTAKMKEVKTGISDYDNIEILSDISDSVEVITGPFLVVSNRLKEGDKIKKAVKKDEAKKD